VDDEKQAWTLWEKVSTVILLLVIIIGTISLACMMTVIVYLLSI